VLLVHPDAQAHSDDWNAATVHVAMSTEDLLRWTLRDGPIHSPQTLTEVRRLIVRDHEHYNKPRPAQKRPVAG